MKNYLIIGGSSGIGQSLSQTLAHEGHQVYATYNEHPVQDTQSNIHYSFLNVLEGNIDPDMLPETLDGVAYCPGSINLKPFTRMDPDAFEKDYRLQVIGAVKVLQAVLPRLKKSESAAVVMFSTVAVQLGFNFHSQVAASKGAIEGLTRSLAAEWAPKIRVNAIAPSLTDTPLAGHLLNSDEKKKANAQKHPLQKIGSPDDISGLAAFLLSDKSSWMTGQVIHVDGGMSGVKL
jgi:NAD(P)-dependent dehydrogenase (short-subunit alcohol dehydrogenase family)